MTGKIDSANLYRVSTSGNVVGSTTLYSMAGASPGMQIVSDAYGILYFTGSFWTQTGFNTGSGTVTLTPAAGSASNNGDIFLLKYNPNLGTTVTLKRDPTAGSAPFQALAPASTPTPQAATFLTFLAPTSDQDLTSLAIELLRTGTKRTRTASRI